MVSSTTKFRLAVAGSLICVVGVALLYKFREEAAGKPPDAPEVMVMPDGGDMALMNALPQTLSSPTDPPSAAFIFPTDDTSRVEYHPPPMQLYTGPIVPPEVMEPGK